MQQETLVLCEDSQSENFFCTKKLLRKLFPAVLRPVWVRKLFPNQLPDSAPLISASVAGQSSGQRQKLKKNGRFDLPSPFPTLNN